MNLPELNEIIRVLDYVEEIFDSPHAAKINAIDSTYKFIKSKLQGIKEFPTLEETLVALDYTNEAFGVVHGTYINTIEATYTYIKGRLI